MVARLFALFGQERLTLGVEQLHPLLDELRTLVWVGMLDTLRPDDETRLLL